MSNFAVVIPNYNQSHFLPYALESLRFQSASFNLAVMDGGSTDHFAQAIKPYADIISVVRSGPDGGQAAAIKEGFTKVDGDILAWLNADDYYFPGALDKVMNYFTAHPDVDVVYGDAVHVSREGFFLSYFPPIQEFSARDLTRTCFICQPACFVRRSAYEKIGGVDASLHFTMDWDLWCRLAAAGARFHYLHEALAAVRYYPGTKTLSGNKRRYLEIWRVERKYGRRLIPLSWPGFYLFDLIFKEKKTMGESIAFQILQWLRRIKKKILWLKNPAFETTFINYGFHRWKTEVGGIGTILLPWYDQHQYHKLNLKVQPDHCRYRISVNDAQADILLAQNGFISLSSISFAKPAFKISIECLDQRNWFLLDFSLESR